MQKGFTLVEVLIGLSIATVAAVSIAYTIANTNKVAGAGKETFIATNLAHEGLELTRKLRDDAWLAVDHSDWVNVICDEGVGDINTDIEFDDNSPLFTRTVSVGCDERSNDPAFITVKSKVDWKNPTEDPKSVELQERLYNWYVTPAP